LHPGVDPIAIVRALAANGIETGVLQGASTITQQLYNIRQEARGIWRKRTLLSKLSQAVWALAEETRRSKREILREYLNTIYWGRSYYGIEAAASGYFGTTKENLTIAQSFFLVERLASPNIVIIDRVAALLKRSSILALFSQDAVAWGELVFIYHDYFRYGDELCRLYSASH
jgi:membrane peptidoglycan carboxypeptidase